MAMLKLNEKKGHVIPAEPRSLTPFEEIDQVFDSLFEHGLLRPFEWWLGEKTPMLRGLRGTMPRVDVIDREDHILIRAEVPGVRKEDLDITLSGDHLLIKGESKEEKEETGEFYRAEIRRGSFSRTIALPTGVVGEQAKARFENGLLEIRIPKAEQETRRKVDIE
jgi:HSP20 family protein